MTTQTAMREMAGDLAYKFPVSAQQRRWIAALESGLAPIPPLWVEIEIKGEFSGKTAAACFEQLLLRHEALRTIVRPVATSWRQIILDQPQQTLEFAQAPVGRDRLQLLLSMRRILCDQVQARDAEALFRGALVSFSPHDHILTFVAHPFVCDLPSLDILVREFAQLYTCAVNPEAVPLPPMELQYADYTHWQELSSGVTPVGETETWCAIWKRSLKPVHCTSAALASVEYTLPSHLSVLDRAEQQAWVIEAMRHIQHPWADPLIALSDPGRREPSLANVVGPVSTLVPLFPQEQAAHSAWHSGPQDGSFAPQLFESLVEGAERDHRSGNLTLPTALYLRPQAAAPILPLGLTLSFRTSPFYSCDALLSADFNITEGEMVIRFTSTVLGQEELAELADSLQHVPQGTPSAVANQPAQPAPVAPDPPAAVSPTSAVPLGETESKLAEIWSAVLGIDDLKSGDDFFDLGGHSLLAVKLTSRVEKVFGIEIPLNSVLEYPTLASFAGMIDRALAQHIRPQPQPKAPHRLVPLQPNGSGPALFWVPGGRGGSVVSLRPVSLLLGQNRPVFGLESAPTPAGEPFPSVEERATAYRQLIQQQQPHGPYYLAGFCLGALAVYEIAQQLRSAGEEVRFVGVVQAFVPITSQRQRKKLERQRRGYMLRKFARFVFTRIFSSRYSLATRQAAQDDVAALMRAWLSNSAQLADDVHIHNVQALSHYRLQPYDGKVCVFLAKDCYESVGVSPAVDPRQAWRKFAKTISTHVVPGDHTTILEPPQASALAEAMESCMNS